MFQERVLLVRDSSTTNSAAIGSIFLFLFFLFYFYLFIYFIFRAAPKAYGGPQARGQIRATAAMLAYTTATTTPDLSWVCDLIAHGNTRSLTH